MSSTENSTEKDQQRESRLARRREAYRRRRDSETAEQREQRLQRRRQQRSNENTEQRETRLSRKRTSEQQQRANQTPEQRETRLSHVRSSTQQQRANQTPEQRETRLSTNRLSTRQQRTNETPEVVDVDDCNNMPSNELTIKGEIIGVNSCENYISCRTCKSKVTKLNCNIGECTKCSTKWKLAKCSKCFAARFVVEDEKSLKHHTVSAYNDILMAISEDVDGEDMEEKLLNAAVMTFYINKNIVVGIKQL